MSFEHPNAPMPRSTLALGFCSKPLDCPLDEFLRHLVARININCIDSSLIPAVHAIIARSRLPAREQTHPRQHLQHLHMSRSTDGLNDQIGHMVALVACGGIVLVALLWLMTAKYSCRKRFRGGEYSTVSSEISGHGEVCLIFMHVVVRNICLIRLKISVRTGIGLSTYYTLFRSRDHSCSHRRTETLS